MRFTNPRSTMSKRISLSEPFLFGKEWRYVRECLDTGWVSTAGQFIGRLEKEICQFTRAKYAVATSSGTAALQIALQVLGIKAGDEVIVPTVTFIAPVNAVHYVGAHPVFMDCDDYYNMDIKKVAEFLNTQTVVKKGACWNRKTKRKISAVIPVHVFGNAVDLGRLIPLCRKFNIKVIEDATESLGTIYTKGHCKGRHPGTLGDAGCYSFNGNKIITAGGGGMMVTNKLPYSTQAYYLTTQAKDDDLYYIHNAVGYNFRLNNIQAAMGTAQLEYLTKILKLKRDHYRIFKDNINPIKGLCMAETPVYANNNHWMYALQIDEKAYGRTRDELIKRFHKENIEVRPLWYLNHLQKPYKRAQTYKIEKAYTKLRQTVNLPCSVGLKKNEMIRIVGLLKKWKR